MGGQGRPDPPEGCTVGLPSSQGGVRTPLQTASPGRAVWLEAETETLQLRFLLRSPTRQAAVAKNSARVHS